MPTLSNYRYFIEITRDMNLEKTASRMYITHQGLSRHIRMLENHYGVKLMHSTPKLELTADGKWLLQRAEEIIKIENSIIEYFEKTIDNSESVIKVGCVYNRIRSLFSDAIRKFNIHYPNVKIEMIPLDDKYFEPNSTSDMDLIITNDSRHAPDMISRELYPNYAYVVVSRKFLRRWRGDSISEFLKDAVNGINIGELPKKSKLIGPDVNDEKWWISKQVPELFEMDQLKLKRYSSEILIEECILGNGIMVVSQFFWDNTLRVFSKEFLQDLYCFPLLRKNEMIYMPEYIKWSSDLNSRESGKFTAPFIRIIESVFLQNQVQGIN